MTDTLHRGSTPDQTEQAINSNLNGVIDRATNQAADGCLNHEATWDKTSHIKAVDTILYTRSETIKGGSGTQTYAAQTEHYQHLLINERREANQLFDAALSKLSVPDQETAIKIMNFVKETIYQDVYNNRNLQFSSSPDELKNSVAEQRVSEAKKLFSSQINHGNFLQNLHAYATNGMRVECKHKDADVVDYNP